MDFKTIHKFNLLFVIQRRGLFLKFNNFYEEMGMPDGRGRHYNRDHKGRAKTPLANSKKQHLLLYSICYFVSFFFCLFFEYSTLSHCSLYYCSLY